MALFGMVWILKLRLQSNTCLFCHRNEIRGAAGTNLIDAGGDHGQRMEFKIKSSQHEYEEMMAPQTHYCEVHGFTPRASGDPAGPFCDSSILESPCARALNTRIPDTRFLSVTDIQEFYELTLLDDSKSVQQKTAETNQIANKWEATDGPISLYSNNNVSILRVIRLHHNVCIKLY